MSKHLHKYLREGAMPSPFCPGCGHGIVMGAVLRAIDELSLDMDNMVFVSGIGCAAWIPSPHFKADTLHTLHGRAVACATGVKLAKPQLKVVVISGDGDLASIGGNHLIHAARKDFPITVICCNNSIYGMTGGQLSPTTPSGVFTETTPGGNPEKPFDLCKVLKACNASFVGRWTVFQTKQLLNALKKGLTTEGFSFINVASPCPVHFGRKNELKTAYDMLVDLKAKTVPFERAAQMGPDELEGKLITGEYR